MKIYCSAKNAGFYVEGVSEIPSDSTEISEVAWLTLLDGQSIGKVIDFSVLPPVLRDYVKLPEVELEEAEAKKQGLMGEANAQIAPLEDAVDLGIATGEETETYNQWRKYRVLLSRVDISTAPDISWPDKP
ncbi:MAG: tail fiber assembly protein [Pantoea agglomerans]